MERAVDLNIGGTTTAGIIDHVTLTVTASPSSALNTDGSDGLKIWIQKCSQEWGESGSSPAFSYTCGGSRSDVLGSTAAQTLPTGGTCPRVVDTVTAVSAASAGPTLANVTLSASASNRFVVFMCLPNTAGNSFQNVTSTLTFTFDAVQRAGQFK